MPRQLLECRHARGDRVEVLLVAGVDRHLRMELRRLVQRADLQDRRRQAGNLGHQMGPASSAEFARDGAFEVLARELLGLPGDVAEAGRRHRDEGVGRAARDILALAAMTLGLHHWIAFGHVAHFAAIASAFQTHDDLPICFSLWSIFLRRQSEIAIYFFCATVKKNMAFSMGRLRRMPYAYRLAMPQPLKARLLQHPLLMHSA